MSQLLYISTGIWVLRTPNAGRNSLVFSRSWFLEKKAHFLGIKRVGYIRPNPDDRI